MADKTKKPGKKCRKHGREKLRHPASKRYTLTARWRKNKAKRIVKMIKKHPNYKIPDNLSSDIASIVRRMLG